MANIRRISVYHKRDRSEDKWRAGRLTSNIGQIRIISVYLAGKANGHSTEDNMAFLQAEQLEALRIDRMIFHVIGPEENELVLLEEIEPGPYADFFIDRLKSTVSGIMFDFLPNSSVLQSLNAIERETSAFVTQSKTMAEQFKIGHGKNTSRGVFFTFVLSAGQERLFALLKYDHETVLSYTIETTGPVSRPLIEQLQDTFVQSPQALQKSALIRLTENGGEVCVKDRVAPTLVTKYFQSFLGARRRFTPEKLTASLAELTKKVAKKCSGELSSDVRKGVRQRLYDTLQTQEGFDPSNSEVFLTSVFGPLPNDSSIRKEFDRELRAARIDGESFNFDRQAVTRPAKRRIVTAEGIEVIFDREYASNVVRQAIAGGRERITIETGGIEEDDDYTDSNSRAR